MPKKKAPLSTDPYKGVRDFYPEDVFISSYIFDTMREVVEHYGYEPYNASILEPAELYESKTSEEIVSEQTYTFTDRGDRRVTLRPEMTPTVARMVAARKRELAFPLRWYSIPNVFRYERPQRGRLREHWQLNCDLFGVDHTEADVEMIVLSYELMRAFGAQEQDFKIKINHRGVVPETLTLLAKQHGLKIAASQERELIRLMDRKDKLSAQAYAEALRALLGEEVSQVVLTHYRASTIRKLITETKSGKEFITLLETLEKRGVRNVEHDPTMVRGFDYYTGMIFEVFDTHPDNKRSLFGGGRYDDLLSLFGGEKIPAVGFGMGDVTIRDYLAAHNLLPDYQPTTDLYLVVIDEATLPFAQTLAQRLRRRDLTVAVDLTLKKVGDQIKTASKKKIPFVLFVGETEAQSGVFRLRNLATKEEHELEEKEIADLIFDALD